MLKVKSQFSSIESCFSDPSNLGDNGLRNTSQLMSFCNDRDRNSAQEVEIINLYNL